MEGEQLSGTDFKVGLPFQLTMDCRADILSCYSRRNTGGLNKVMTAQPITGLSCGRPGFESRVWPNIRVTRVELYVTSHMFS